MPRPRLRKILFSPSIPVRGRFLARATLVFGSAIRQAASSAIHRLSTSQRFGETAVGVSTFTIFAFHPSTRRPHFIRSQHIRTATGLEGVGLQRCRGPLKRYLEVSTLGGRKRVNWLSTDRQPPRQHQATDSSTDRRRTDLSRANDPARHRIANLEFTWPIDGIHQHQQHPHQDHPSAQNPSNQDSVAPSGTPSPARSQGQSSIARDPATETQRSGPSARRALRGVPGWQRLPQQGPTRYVTLRRLNIHSTPPQARCPGFVDHAKSLQLTHDGDET